ncbi:MAG: hypothetical protein RR506_09840 [Akkermansia sp.]
MQPVTAQGEYAGIGYLNGVYYGLKNTVQLPFFGWTPISELPVGSSRPPTGCEFPPGGREIAKVLRYMLFVKQVKFNYLVYEGGKKVQKIQTMKTDPLIRDARSAWVMRSNCLLPGADATAAGTSHSPLTRVANRLVGTDGVEGHYDFCVKVYHYAGTSKNELWFGLNPGLNCLGFEYSNIEIEYFI